MADTEAHPIGSLWSPVADPEVKPVAPGYFETKSGGIVSVATDRYVSPLDPGIHPTPVPGDLSQVATSATDAMAQFKRGLGIDLPAHLHAASLSTRALRQAVGGR